MFPRKKKLTLTLIRMLGAMILVPAVAGRNIRSVMGRKSKMVKIVVFVPETHADIIREAMGKAGAGRIGKYTFCSFSIKGIGRFKPGKGTNPKIGKIEKLELVKEERIEMVCEKQKLKNVRLAIKKVHPYEEIAIDVYSLEKA